MKKSAFLLLICCSLLFQSCFEIIEQLTLKADGSGTFQLVLNMSKSKTKLNSIMKMKMVNGHPVPDKAEITQKVSEFEAAIKKTPGISNVKTALDFDNYIATLNCSFTKVSSLNAAIKSFDKKNEIKGSDKTYEYDAASATFNRLNKFAMQSHYQKMSNADKEVFATANYTGIFRFDNDITSASNKASKVAGNKKAVMLKANTLDIITGKTSIENNIHLNKQP